MRRLFISAVIALVLVSGLAFAGQVQNPPVYPVPVANGGTGQVGGLVFNTNTSATAVANTTAINAALASGGQVNIGGSGILYVNTLSICSNTQLTVAPTVTIRIFASSGNTNTPILVNCAYSTSFAALGAGGTGGITWTSGTTVATYNLPSHGLSVGSWVWINPNAQGAVPNTDSAFIGVFQVASVTDANNVVLQLWRQPASLTAANLQWKPVDTNITVTGGIWDQNIAGLITYGASGSLSMGMYFLGVEGLWIKNVHFTGTLSGGNISNFNFTVAAASHFVLDGIEGAQPAKDSVKIFGPAFDGVVQNLRGQASDDVVSWHTDDYTVGGSDLANGGDIIMQRAYAGAEFGYGYAIYATSQSFYTDDILVDGIQQNDDAQYGFKITAQGTTGTVSIGSVTLRNFHCQSANQTCFGSSNTTVAANINDLTIDHMTTPTIGGSGSGSYIFPQFTSGTINHLHVTHMNCTVGGSEYCIKLSGTFNDVLIDNSSFAGTGNAVTLLSGSTAQTITFRNNVAPTDTLNSIFGNSGTLSLLNLDSNNVNAGIGFSVGSVPVVVSRGNYAQNTSGGFLRAGSVGVAKVYSSGNVISSNYLYATSSSATWTPYGFDIPCSLGSVSTTGANVNMTRTTGAFCQNTNASPGSGTLTAVGPVMDQGTSSGSWFALYSPTLQTY